MKLSYIKYTGQKLSAAIVAGALSGFYGSTAYAQGAGTTNLDQLVRQFGSQTESIPDLIATLAYIGGAAFSAFGVISLKKHVDNPANEPLKNGLGRLAAGGALLAVPTFSDVMVNTLGLNSGSSADLETFGSGFKPFNAGPNPAR